jgi:hypothetical protein
MVGFFLRYAAEMAVEPFKNGRCLLEKGRPVTVCGRDQKPAFTAGAATEKAGERTR